MTVGKKVRYARKKQELTQREIARRTELSISTIKKIEQGNQVPRKITLQKIADALDMSLEELIGSENTEFITLQSNLTKETIVAKTVIIDIIEDHLEINKTLIQDKSLSLDARGLIWTIIYQAQKYGGGVNLKNINDCCVENETKIQMLLNELKEHNYVIKTKSENNCEILLLIDPKSKLL